MGKIQIEITVDDFVWGSILETAARECRKPAEQIKHLFKEMTVVSFDAPEPSRMYSMTKEWAEDIILKARQLRRLVLTTKQR